MRILREYSIFAIIPKLLLHKWEGFVERWGISSSYYFKNQLLPQQFLLKVPLFFQPHWFQSCIYPIIYWIACILPPFTCPNHFIGIATALLLVLTTFYLEECNSFLIGISASDLLLSLASLRLYMFSEETVAPVGLPVSKIYNTCLKL